MPDVNVEVAGRPYRVGCEAGQEDHLARLAGMVDAEASKLAGSMGQVSEGRLMLLTALMIADRLTDAEAAIAKAEGLAANAQKLAAGQAEPAGMISPEREAQIADNLDQLAARIEALAGRFERPA